MKVILSDGNVKLEIIMIKCKISLNYQTVIKATSTFQTTNVQI